MRIESRILDSHTEESLVRCLKSMLYHNLLVDNITGTENNDERLLSQRKYMKADVSEKLRQYVIDDITRRLSYRQDDVLNRFLLF